MTGVPTASRRPSGATDTATALAAEVKACLEAGDRQGAADRFGDLVAAVQRRAVRLAYYYLANTADADDAVQDAFVKVYAHMTSYRTDQPFEAWFTRILVNTCLDRLKARRRQPGTQTSDAAEAALRAAPSPEPSPERRLLADSTWRAVADAVRALPDRQREAFVLCHVHETSPAEAAEVLGLNPATLRVHLFRAVRKLRAVLEGS
jgi:RNA polymerase sigma-70 factor (ECF subfamily)